MNKKLFLSLLSIFWIVGCKELPSEVVYPEGYRDWTHVKSLELKEKHPLFSSFGGLHHIYTNDLALNAMKAKTKYPDGSVLIFDLFEVESTDAATSEGKRKVLGVMYKNMKAFPETKGWGFEGFAGDTKDRLVSGKHGSCFGCHATQTNTDYTFSEYRN
jgi:hypothetical protein